MCVREEGQNSLAIIDSSTKTVLRLPVQVDSAIMNPVSKVVALRAGNNLQIYNLEMKSRVKTTTMDNVVYWKWLDPKTLAIVNDKAVFHWSMDGDSKPSQQFARNEYSAGPVQIINYSVSADKKWMLLGGIAASSNGIAGVLQVYSVDAKASQPSMDAHAAAFSNVTIDGRSDPSNLFCFTRKTPAGSTLNILEVGVPKDQAFKKSSPIQFQGDDFPVSMIADDKYGVLFIISKAGLLFLYEIQSGKLIFAQQASRVTMFTSCSHDDNGIAAIDQNGRMSHFFVDEANIVPFVTQNLKDLGLGVEMAKRYNLPGAEQIFVQQFERLMSSQQYQQAMELAANSPQGILRTTDTIARFKQIPNMPGQSSSPLLQYFTLLLKKGALNTVESIELAGPVLAKGHPQGLKHVEGWLKESKLECSEALGDLLKQYDVNLALSVYVRAKVPEKVIGCFLALGAREQDDAAARTQFEKIFRYAKQINFTPNYGLLVQQLIRVNPARAKDFGLMLIRSEEGPSMDINSLVDAFMSANDVKNTTNILLEYLKSRGDREEDAALQTKLLEINLFSAPQIADAIMESDDYNFTHYDRLKIAQLCERAQLYQRALEHYTEIEDIKRVLGNAQLINPEFLLEFFGRMTPESCLECLRDLLKYNMQANIRLVVEVAKKWSDYLTSEKLIQLFEEFKNYNGLYFYLGSFVNTTEDSDVIFKYIEAAVKLNQLKEVERVCRDNEHYDAAQVKAFLLEENMKDPRPLIHVCDRFGFVDELTRHLYNQSMFPFIEAYVQRMNSRATPEVVGSLLDLNANEEQVITLLSNIRAPVDDPTFMERLVEAAESRNRLRILRGWLEARANEGNEDPNLHNGLAKIYVDINSNPQQFLTNNQFYNSKVVGTYCESRDPHLAFIAYKRAWGECDDELIEVTNKNGFFKDQARYLVERQSLELWAKVLNDDNEFKRELIDQVVATALPESRAPEEVSTTVKAFMAANLPNELIELLERIILHGPSDGVFHNNKNLQNLLILTAIKADKQRVMDYLNRLDNYDGPDIAKIAVSEQYELYEEAFFIYKKFKKGDEAITVLIDHIDSVERAAEFADYWDQPDVWSILGRAQLERDLVLEAIESFLKASDPAQYLEVIHAAKRSNLFTELISYILMAREKVKETVIDNELIYAYAKTDKLAQLEEFIAGPNVAKLEQAGDLCFNERLYEAGRILFTHIKNNAKLAICLVKLELFSEAVEAARKANAIPTWKEVCFSCVEALKFRLAQICALNIIVYNDHLVELCRYYERRGHFEELIVVLEQGINLDRAHQGIYTQLGVLYSKYKEPKLMEHIKLFWSRLNIPTLLQACKEGQHWNEAVFLYTHYDQFDNAVDVMIQHSTEAWTNDKFKDVISKVSNTEIYYRAIDFYVQEHPLLLNDLLLDLSGNLDHTRVVSIIRSKNYLALIQKYLLHVQRENLIAINEAVNELFLEEEDYKSLRESIDVYDQFDMIAMAKRLEKHDLLELRRISAYLYKLNKRWDKSIELSKTDELWLDATETVAESGDRALAEGLLRFFVEKGLNECYSACLFSCYELIRPDIVLELSWRYGLTDNAMPFMIQSFREFSDKLDAVTAKLESAEKKKQDEENAKKAEDADRAVTDAQFVGPGSYAYNAPLAIMGPGVAPMGPGHMQPPPGAGYGPSGYNPHQQQW